MKLIQKIGEFLTGSGTNILDSLSDVVDRFITNPDEKKAFELEIKRIEEQHSQNQRQFLAEMEQLTQKRESEVEQTIRAELKAQENILVAELQQGDRYTKRARPTVIYVGLFFILLELFGIRHVVLDQLELGENALSIIEGSDAIFKTFLAAWAGVVGVYAVGRSMEKRGTRQLWNQAFPMLGNLQISTSNRATHQSSKRSKPGDKNSIDHSLNSIQW
ncbi:MAG: hypothetical protein JEZ14_08155 [Marinilabiliaceae bacterium]|nr:hypothetical protein [Marinilabiliaceae bacterium]